MRWRWLGTLPHAEAWAEQERVRAAVLAGDDSAGQVLLCSHPAVITLGRSAQPGNVLVADDERVRLGVDLVRTDRGGDVTLHDEGQLMVYAVVRLRAGVAAFLEAVAEVLAAQAARCGVPGAVFRCKPAGLWLDDAKLAACGIHLQRGVVAHGYAFNVATAPARWELIKPCGLTTPVVSLAQACAARGLPPPPPPAELATQVGPALAERLR